MRFFVLFLFPFYSLAQTDTLQGFIALGGQLTQGNYKSYTEYFQSNLSVSSDKNEWSIAPSFRYTKNEANNISQIKEKELYSNESYTRKFNRWRFLVFSEYEQSYLRKIQFRGNFGTGMGYKIYKNNKNEIDISSVVLPEYYESMLNEINNYSSIRSSTRLHFEYSFSNITISSVFIYQAPIITRGNVEISPSNNTNMRSTTNFDVQIKKQISLGFMVDYIYQSYAAFVSKLSPDDLTFTFYLKYKI